MPGSGIVALTWPTDTSADGTVHHGSPGNIIVKTPKGSILASHGGILQLSLNSSTTKNSSILLEAGCTDASGKTYIGNIDAENSGVIGGNITMKATGDIKGLVYSSGNLNLSSGQNINVSALSMGTANISAQGSIAGSISGLGGLNISGESISAALASPTATTSGSLSGAAANAPETSTSASASQAAAQTAQQTTKSDDDDSDNSADGKKKKKEKPLLAEYVGRIKILPQAE
jgi:hypothetical protein